MGEGVDSVWTFHLAPSSTPTLLSLSRHHKECDVALALRFGLQRLRDACIEQLAKCCIRCDSHVADGAAFEEAASKMMHTAITGTALNNEQVRLLTSESLSR